MTCCERNLEELKKEYALLEKKHGLPSFYEMNKEFGIEELNETDFLVRGMRKIIVEKLSFFSKFIEVVLNPSEGGSLFVFSIAKTLNQENRKSLAGVYEKISKFQIESLKRDISYSEEEEIEFVKRIYSFWESAKKELVDSLEVIESNWDNHRKKDDKSYFR